MFKLIVKKEFSSAHILHGHPGNCKRMHGHNWLVEAEVQGDNINEIGMVIDLWSESGESSPRKTVYTFQLKILLQRRRVHMNARAGQRC